MSEAAPQLADEVVTHSLVRDVPLPGGGTLALITLDNGLDHTRPNTLGPQSLQELSSAIADCRTRAEAGELQAVALTGKPYIFAAGADLTGVSQVTSRDQALAVARAGHAAYGAMSDLPVPTFAFINGVALGGGLEAALACDYRTVDAHARALGLPEAFLGLVPGWGGAWHLPRLIGPEKALKVIIENPLSMNRMLSGPALHKLGIADVMLDSADFLEESIAWAGAVVHGQTPTREPVTDDPAVWQAAVDTATAFAQAKTGGKAPGPIAAIELVHAARTATREDGFAAEDEALADLIMSDELRAGLYAFDLNQKRAKRPAGAPDKALARPVTKIGVVGAGLMASQLALLMARKLEVPVLMTDLDQDRVDKGLEWVRSEIAGLLEKGRLSADAAARVSGLITGSTSKDGCADADLVIEAVFEEIAIKKKVFAELEAIVSPECVLASNTSSLSITQMAQDLDHPERVVGLHFFNPVAVMPLIEVIQGERTNEMALATGFAVARGLGKTAILVKDSPSFVVNRILGRFLGEFARVVDEGTPEDVANEAIAGLVPMPPAVLLELVGKQIALHNNETLHAAFGERFYVSEALVTAVRDNIELSAARVPPKDPVVLSAQQARQIILSGLADEAGRMLSEGVVQAPMDLDLALITGAGFQFWNGGLTPLLDREGISEAVNGQRFLPPGVASVP